MTVLLRPVPVLFQISRSGKKSYVDQHWEARNATDFRGPEEIVEETNDHVIKHLRPWTNYTFKVGVIRDSTREKYWARSIGVRTLASTPPFLDPPEFAGAPNSQHVSVDNVSDP